MISCTNRIHGTAAAGFAALFVMLIIGSGAYAQQTIDLDDQQFGQGPFGLDEQGRRDLERFQSADPDRDFDAFGTNEDAIQSEFDIDAIGNIIRPEETESGGRIGHSWSAGDVDRTIPPVRNRGNDPVISNPVVSLTPPGDRKPAFRIGIVPRGDVSAMLDGLDKFRRSLSLQLDRPVEILPMSTFDALVDAQVLKRIDMAVYSTSAYITADKLCRCVEPLVAPAAFDGGLQFFGLILTKRGSGVGSIADLEGKKIAVGPIDSIGARIVQMASLKADGIEPETYFGEIVSTRSSMDAVLDLRDGWVDAAMAWGSMSGDKFSGYSRGTLTYLTNIGAISMNEIEVIWKSRPLVHGPIGVLKSLGEEEKETLRSILIDLNETDPEIYDLLDVVFGGGYREVEPADYRGADVLAQQDVAGIQQRYSQPAPRGRPEPPPGYYSGSVDTADPSGAISPLRPLTLESPDTVQ